ncbi:hypothetical protein HNI00_01695 [Thermoleptolyngbya oregonensis NK1-22]|uniref:Uncharacterized protein n=1 Tax=Thermoleptolyngbya oregonensis NK1-22 TaxID=2547457 RepID=A0AA96Y8J3_9CYAN|nr:hypothetical protein [Thermoleptolyngbya oregonensis]WOB42020.1 hypothetical protein HNI00_01695 [Thermoleptolyngbya oregonensis NK1-22]
MAGIVSFDLGPKPTHRENGHLVLKCPSWERPSAIVLLALSCLWLGFISNNRLTCDRPDLSTINCQVVRTLGVNLIPRETVRLGSLTTVQVVSETRSSDDGDFLVYDLKLSGTEAVTRLGLDTVDEARAQQMAEAVQRFLANPARSSVTIQTLSGWGFLWVPLGLTSLAIALLRRKPHRFEFNRLMGKMQALGANGRLKQELWLREIQSVVIEQCTGEDLTGYSVVLLTQQGDRHPLTETYSSNLESKQEAAEAIRAFLGLPPVEIKEV